MPPTGFRKGQVFIHQLMSGRKRRISAFSGEKSAPIWNPQALTPEQVAAEKKSVSTKILTSLEKAQKEILARTGGSAEDAKQLEHQLAAAHAHTLETSDLPKKIADLLDGGTHGLHKLAREKAAELSVRIWHQAATESTIASAPHVRDAGTTAILKHWAFGL